MNRLTSKEESLPGVYFDGCNLFYKGKVAAGVEVSEVPDQNEVYRMGHRLLTPTRMTEVINCPACWPTRKRHEETEAMKKGREIHEVIAKNPLEDEGGEVEYGEELRDYYRNVAEMKARNRVVEVGVEEARLIGLYPTGIEYSYDKWEDVFRRGKKIRMNLGYSGGSLFFMPRSDQVFNLDGRKLVRDLKYSGGKKASNVVQLMTEALGYLEPGKGFPEMSIYNIRSGCEEKMVSLDSRATLWWYFQLALWSHLVMIGGWRVPNPEHRHAPTTEVKLKTPKGEAEYRKTKIPGYKVNGKWVGIGECYPRALDALKKLEASVEMVV